MGLSLRWRYGKYHWVTLIMYDFLGPQEWANIPLYEIATWKNGAAFKSTNFSQVGLPVIKIAELKNGITEQTKRTDGRFSDDIFITKGDMVFAWSGSPQTSIDTFIWEGENGWLNQHIFKVVPKDFIGDQFLFFLLKSLRSRFIRIALNKQTTGLGHVTISDLKEMRVGVPHQSEQQSIVKILAPLQEKIENNRRMNETLEEMARAIFKSWFVDFDPVHAKAAGNAPAHMDADTAALFPSLFGDDGLPVGWETSYLKEHCNIVYGKNLPTKNLLLSGYPVFGGNGVIGFHSEFLYETPQVLVACRGAASGKVIRSLPFSFVTNNSLIVEIQSEHFNRFYLELYLRDLTLEGFTTGSAQPQMTIANMDAVKLLDPKREVLNCFKNMAEPLFRKVLANDEENQTLTELRDTLLPKLMSGELRVADAEREVEAAV